MHHKRLINVNLSVETKHNCISKIFLIQLELTSRLALSILEMQKYLVKQNISDSITLEIRIYTKKLKYQNTINVLVITDFKNTSLSESRRKNL